MDIALAKRNILSRVGNTRRVTVGSLLRYKNLWQYVYLYIYIYILYKYSYLPMSNTVVSCNKPHRQWNRIGLASAESTRRFLLAVQSPLSERRKKKEKKRTIVCGFCDVRLLCARVRLCLYTRFYTVQSLTTRSMALYKYLPIYLSIHLSINQLIPCRNTSSNCLTCFGQSLPQPLHLTAAPSASR